jgi:hypothetical protein
MGVKALASLACLAMLEIIDIDIIAIIFIVDETWSRCNGAQVLEIVNVVDGGWWMVEVGSWMAFYQ